MFRNAAKEAVHQLEDRVDQLESAVRDVQRQFQQQSTSVQEQFQNAKLEQEAAIEEQQRRTEAVSVELWAQFEAFRTDIGSQLESGTAELRGELQTLGHSANEALVSQSNTMESRLQQLTTLSQELISLRSQLDAEQATTQSLESTIMDKVAAQAEDVERLREALSGDGSKLLRFLDEERQRGGNLHVEGTSAEWLVRDIKAWVTTLPNGQALDSPVFNVDVPGLGRLHGLRLRFFPNGGKDVTNGSNCSLYLVHPETMPWAQYELTVGNSRRGIFDPIFVGSDDFCNLEPELADIDGAPAVRLGVHFCTPAGQSVGRELTPWKVNLESTPPPLQAPQAGGLWLSSNRLHAGYG